MEKRPENGWRCTGIQNCSWDTILICTGVCDVNQRVSKVLGYLKEKEMKLVDFLTDVSFFIAQVAFAFSFYAYCQNSPDGTTYCFLSLFALAVVSGIRSAR